MRMACAHNFPADNLECLAIHECVRNRPPGVLQDAAEGRPRDVHFGCTLLVRISLQIRQPQGLKSILRQHNLLE